MANYGDVALNLSPNWSRSKLHNIEGSAFDIGHEDGIADVYLKDDEDKRHQFAWVDPRHHSEIDFNRTKGYQFVKQADGWVKNERLWEWDAEGRIKCGSHLLMARDGALYFKELEQRRIRRDEVMGKVGKDDEEAMRLAARRGIQVTGEEDGVTVSKGRRARR